MGLRARLARGAIRRTWGSLVAATWTWKASSSELALPCPYCGTRRGSWYCRWAIDEHFGLFESSDAKRSILYGTVLPVWMPQRVKSLCREEGFQRICGTRFVRYRRCDQCELVYQDFPHRQDVVSAYYRRWYRVECQNPKDGSFGRSDARWIGQQQQLADYFLTASTLRAGDRVLDVGCAEGWSCDRFERAGLVAHGIEPSAQMVTFARARLGLRNARCGEYAAASYPEAFFDGIVSHHVVEHLVDLRVFAEAIGKHLKRGGWFLLQTPCSDTLMNDGDRAEICRGGHIYCFSKSFAERFVREVGLEIVESRITPLRRDDLLPEDRGPWNTSRWADDPGGVSVLARKP